MPGNYDESTRQITLPCGDTFDLWIDVEWDALTEGDVILFAVYNSSGEDVLIKAAEIEDGTAHIRICNHDTRDIAAGRYKWNLRLVTDPERDESGNVYAADCSDNVITVFDTPPTFKLWKGGAYV